MIFKLDVENPQKKPLNELVFFVKEDGVQLKISALNERWIEKRCYTKYRGLPIVDGQISNQAALDEWLTENEWFNKDLEYFLGLEHFRFWSHLTYEPRCIESVISFLQEATPFYTPLLTVTDNENVINLYTKILRNILAIICRMITNKETEFEWITKEHLKDLLYLKFLISIPMIFDLIVAYGRSNLSVLTRIIQTIFNIEPKYKDDLKIGLQFLQKSLKIIQQKTENEGFGNDNEPVSSFDDLALYTLDCITTLSILLEIYPDARCICGEIQLEQSITHFYDNTIPLLYTNLFTIDSSSRSLKLINHARIELLKAFRSITFLHIENILKDPENSLLPAESFIAILTECLGDRTFVVDYQNYYPVQNDIDILRQACNELDVFKADFILNAYTSEGESYMMNLIQKQHSVDLNGDERYQVSDKITNGAIASCSFIPSSSSPKSRNIQNEVTQVQDILPHLGDGFIRRLLTRYDDPESVVAAVLEGNLPPDLLDADQNEIYIPPNPEDTLYVQTGIQRLNVFDGDAYDVMVQDNPDCIIKSGKGFPGHPKNAKDLLDDKSHVKEMKSRYQEYSMVSDDLEYDDEYDDSYDALAESEAKRTKSRAIQNVQNVLVDEIDDDDESEEEENENNEKDGNPRDRNRDFCENPEVIRARYEAKRNAKYGNRGNSNGAQKSTDLVGKPKGQGQEKDVANNRHKKDVHKSSRANHNRKTGASWKRNRGMVPS